MREWERGDFRDHQCLAFALKDLAWRAISLRPADLKVWKIASKSCLLGPIVVEEFPHSVWKKAMACDNDSDLLCCPKDEAMQLNIVHRHFIQSEGALAD